MAQAITHCLIEANKHAAWFNDVTPKLEWIDSEDFERNNTEIKKLSNYDGLIVPGGFGSRGIDGIIAAIKYARENKMPYLGLCYGMQLACVEFARNVLKYKDAHTIEVDPDTTNPIFITNPNQTTNIRENRYGGTMRLGAYDCVLNRGTKSAKAYGVDKISERHRHRYEFNNKYREPLEKAGLKVAGVNPESNLVEIVELENHPFFVGVQFHPEFKSRPMRPHPLFREFVRVACK